MLRSVSILLTMVLLTQTFYRLGLYYDYEVNKEYITLRYCENRNKPGLHCEGKCEMMKRLNAGIKKELPADKTELQQDIQLFIHKTDLGFSDIRQPEEQPAIALLHLPQPIQLAIFHPPCNA